MRERTITLSIHTPPHPINLQCLQKGFGYFAAGIWSCSLAPSLWDAAAFELTEKCFLITVEAGRGVEPRESSPMGRGKGQWPRALGKPREAPGSWIRTSSLLQSNLHSRSQETPSQWKVSFQALCYSFSKPNKSYLTLSTQGKGAIPILISNAT